MTYAGLFIALLSLGFTVDRAASYDLVGGEANVAGTWTSATLEDASPVLRPDCLAVSITDRKLTLKAVSGTNRIEGEWVRWRRRTWLTQENQTCRWFGDETKFEPILGAAWTYTITGQSDDKDEHHLTLHGKYSSCLGNACTKWKVYPEDFNTELRLVGNTLIDTNGTEDPVDDVEFVRLSEDDDIVDAARDAADKWLKLIDLGQLDSVYDRGTTSSFKAEVKKDDFRRNVLDHQARYGTTTARKYLISTHVLYAPNTKGRTDYAVFSNLVTKSHNVSGAEFVVLAKEEGEWRICWLR